ncbi:MULTISPECIES: hypothetical protein [Pseudomonas]|uniref:hypothetical protein n=1 Tax=Pseudomonas TaxID=286 RepID=UPI0015964A94|nr:MULTISPECIES: hypothetical protein [Pseudomonas]
MPTHYSSAITAWMKQNRSHLNWDLTFATRPEPINDLVALAHYSHEDSALGDIEGEVALPNSDVTHILTGYRMGAPSLVELQANYTSPKVRQSIALEGGTHLVMDKTEGLLGLSVHDLLDPLRVTQTLPLTADAQGVRADLREGTDTELDLGGGLPQRLAAGRLFKDVVSSLGSARQVYPLVDFQGLSANPYLQVRHSEVRTHVSKASGKPALVVFAGVNNGPLGNFPGEQSDYPFLLPDDLAQPVDSTLLLTTRFLHRAAYATGLAQMLEGGAFDARFDLDKTLQRLDAKAGRLQVHPSTYESNNYKFSCEAFDIAVGAGAPLDTEGSQPMATGNGQTCCCACCTGAAVDEQATAPLADFQSPLSVTFEHDEVRQHWKSYCTLRLSYKAKPEGAWQAHTATFQFDLQTAFTLNEPVSPEESAGCMLLGQVLWPWQQAAEVTPVSGLPTDMLPAVREEICAFVAFVIKQAVLEGLARQLTAMIPEQVMAGLSLAGGERLLPFHFQLPDGMAMFARGHGAAGMRIVDRPMLLQPAQRHTFSVEPHREGLVWSREALPGTVGDLGRIDPVSGEYRAPPAHAMLGEPVRLQIIATDPLTGQRSTSMATVSPASLTANPLIQVCYFEDSLTFTAGTLVGALVWSVVDEGEPGRGSVTPHGDGRGCTYTAGAKLEDNVTYLLDEVRVRNTVTGESRSIHVLVRQRRPELVIEVEQLPDGDLQLRGRVYGQVMPDTQWKLPIEGTGEIDESTGRYSAASAHSDARFALITAKWALPDTPFIFEGHLSLLLPLSLHFDAARRAAHPAGLRVAKSPSFGG